jgi:hypothetical protein
VFYFEAQLRMHRSSVEEGIDVSTPTCAFAELTSRSLTGGFGDNQRPLKMPSASCFDLKQSAWGCHSGAGNVAPGRPGLNSMNGFVAMMTLMTHITDRGRNLPRLRVAFSKVRRQIASVFWLSGNVSLLPAFDQPRFARFL